MIDLKGREKMGWLILALIIDLCASYFLAGQFSEAASEKGYHSRKYFWISFLLGLPGWLLVMALPDRGHSAAHIEAAISDELPEL